MVSITKITAGVAMLIASVSASPAAQLPDLQFLFLISPLCLVFAFSMAPSCLPLPASWAA